MVMSDLNSSQNMQSEPPQTPHLQAISDLLKNCLQCERPIELELLQKTRNRCKRCERAYLDVWFRNHEEFLTVFAGQI